MAYHYNKRKQVVYDEPLLIRDRVIYLLICLVGGAAALASLWFLAFGENYLSLLYPDAMAVSVGWELFWIAVVFMGTMSAAAIAAEGLTRKVPLTVVPDRELPERVKDHKTTVDWLIYMFLLFVVGAAFLPIALFGSPAIHSDGTIHIANGYGKVEIIEPEDFTEHSWECWLDRGGKRERSKWEIRLVITTEDGRSFTFDQENFRNEERYGKKSWVCSMMEVYEALPRQTGTCAGADKLGSVLAEWGVNSSDASRLRRIFRELGD